MGEFAADVKGESNTSLGLQGCALCSNLIGAGDWLGLPGCVHGTGRCLLMYPSKTHLEL
jgi:hypothetical protein